MAELGDTEDPTELVPGDPATLNSTVEELRSYGDVLHEAGTGLTRIDTAEGWTGQAGDRFRSVFDGEPRKWLVAGDSFHAAGSAVDRYSTTLTWAQGQAADAVRQWKSAEAASAQARAQQPDQPPGMPFPDPGDAGRQAARQTLDRARRQLDAAGNTAADAVDAAKDKAPPKPGFWSRVGTDLADAAETVGQTLENVAKEAVNGVASFGNAAINHPDQAAAAAGGAALTAVSGLGEGAGGVLDASGIGLPAGLSVGAISTAGIVTGVGITGAATAAMAMEAAGEDHVQVFETDSDGANTDPGEDPPFEPPNEIKGYKPHARERMFENTRGDGGVNDEAAKDAVESPTKPPEFQADGKGGKYLYRGKDAVVVLNKDGEVVSAWPKGSAGRRFP